MTVCVKPMDQLVDIRPIGFHHVVGSGKAL